MKNKILIFTATYNESENIKNFLTIVEKLNLNADVLVIDDNSPDNTSEIIKDYSINNKNIHLIIRSSKLGLDTAHKTAYNYALDNNYKFLITLDADLTHNPEIIPNFINELDTCPFVIGSRYIHGGKTDMKGGRLFLSYFGNKFIKLLLNIKCSEFTTSFRGFNLNMLTDFNLNIVSSKGYSFFMETLYQLNKKKIPIKEIPIHAKQRDKGRSKIARIELMRTLFNVIKLKFFD